MRLLALVLCAQVALAVKLPLVINTWSGDWVHAAERGWNSIAVLHKPTLDALQDGLAECETIQCGTTVGFGGSPDEIGETTLDAMIMNGDTMAVGAVCDLRRVKNAIGVARAVMDHSLHTMLAGESATNFANDMGFKVETLTTANSSAKHNAWVNANCQPNFRKNVLPDPTTSCGPYRRPAQSGQSLEAMAISAAEETRRRAEHEIGPTNHDTIGMIVVDERNHVMTGTTTNGLRNKIAGRVGDSPITGAGSFADSDVGGCAGTGDGDTMMRFLPCYQAVESMRLGLSPQAAADDAIKRIIRKAPGFNGAIIVANRNGDFGAACRGSFAYSVRNPEMPNVVVVNVPCM